MSFQRMLMMATREVRPYLPHPEALVALYVPRWQISPTNILQDFSGEGLDMTIAGGKWSIGQEGFTQSFSTRTQHLNVGTRTLNEYTAIADRKIFSNYASKTRGFGLHCGYVSNITCMVTERYQNRVIQTASGSVYTTITPPNLDGVIAVRDVDYCGQPITKGSEHRWRYDISCSRLEPLWEKMRYIALWAIRLTDEEIEMAKLFLSTASLEDYMMNRL